MFYTHFWSTAKFRFHAIINFLIQLNYVSIFFIFICVSQSGDIELNPSPKSRLSLGLSICHRNLNSLAALSFSKVNFFETYNSVHRFNIICILEAFLDSTIRLDHQKQPLEVFYKKGVFKNVSNFIGKHLCWIFFLIKLQAFRPATLWRRGSNTGVFLWNLRHF